VVSVLDSGAEGTGFKSQPRRCRVTVLGKLLTPIVPLFVNANVAKKKEKEKTSQNESYTEVNNYKKME